MSLTRNEFSILKALVEGGRQSQRALAGATGLSVGTVNAAVRSCAEGGLVEDGLITEEGLAALRPYKVDNAIIMAAGMSSRFAPISYERPKGVLKVRGEVLVERQIRQLQEAGIHDITIVVGYMKEQFFYLERKFGVHIVVNPDYLVRNNTSTLWRVRNRLANTYICSSDDYFTQNPFERYVYKAYYAAEYSEGPTKEWCMQVGAHDRITGVTIGGSDAWYMLGHAYFDRAFSNHFVEVLGEEYDLPQTRDKLWEDIFSEHVGEFDMEIRRYEPGVINEFDSLDEVREFDPHFIENVDSSVLTNIASKLGCAKDDVHDIVVLKQGLTNLSFRFTVDGQKYVYRHPGVGTSKFINRHAETMANEAAHRMGIDPTFIYEDEQRGWKLSRFVDNARTLDPSNPEQVRRAMQAARAFHESGVTIDASFDFFQNGVGYENLLKQHGPITITGYDEMREKVVRLNQFCEADGYPKVFSHNDYLPLNFLFDEHDNMSIIDWEFAGMSDPGNDFGTFVICSEYNMEQGDAALDAYFDGNVTFEQRRHFWARVVLGGWCWYVWALEKDAEGAGVGEWLYIYYSYCANYIDTVLGWYENGEPQATGEGA